MLNKLYIMELLIEPYQKAIYEWPQQGEVILAQFDDDGIWVCY